MRSLERLNPESQSNLHPFDLISLTFEQALNSQVDALDLIFQNIQIALWDAEELEIDVRGSADVLNKKDYPTGYAAFESFYKYQRKTRYNIPIHSMFGKRISREPLTNEEATDKKRDSFVKPSLKSPQCYRYAIQIQGIHLGDIFIVPVIASRSKSMDIRQEKHAITFEAILVTADAYSNKKILRRRNRKKYFETIDMDTFPIISSQASGKDIYLE